MGWVYVYNATATATTRQGVKAGTDTIVLKPNVSLTIQETQKKKWDDPPASPWTWTSPHHKPKNKLFFFSGRPPGERHKRPAQTLAAGLVVRQICARAPSIAPVVRNITDHACMHATTVERRCCTGFSEVPPHLTPLHHWKSLPLLNPGNFVPENGFLVMKALRIFTNGNPFSFGGKTLEISMGRFSERGF